MSDSTDADQIEQNRCEILFSVRCENSHLQQLRCVHIQSGQWACVINLIMQTEHVYRLIYPYIAYMHDEPNHEDKI